MFIQGLHKQKCGLMQSEMDPCIFFKIVKDEETNAVKDYLVAIIWVDDCRYFGNAGLVKEYEEMNCKCTLEGVAKEFVSIKILHDVNGKPLELTQEDYWVKAVERFKDFLPSSDPKERLVPLSPTDELCLLEPTEEDLKEASHLPFPNLLGLFQYPSAYTRLEMRFAMSILSRFRTKWGKKHFEILVKTLEYGYATRKMGLRYDGNQGDDNKTNVLEGFADSSLSLPRSQGCRCIIMNNAAISFTSKRHTKTRAMMVITIRNKIEDMKVVSMYLRTSEMIADIGTKSLEPKLCTYLRDKLCGYGRGEG